MLQNQLCHALVTGNHHTAHIRHASVVQNALIVFHACKGEETLPAVQMLLGVRHFFSNLVKASDRVSIGQWCQRITVKAVRLEDGGRITVPDLERLNIVGVSRMIDIQQQLSGGADASDGIV